MSVILFGYLLFFLVKPSLKTIDEEWKKTAGPVQIKEAAEYYGIYDDLFENGYFTPLTPLDISYTYTLDEQYVSPVFRGNVVKPYEVGGI